MDDFPQNQNFIRVRLVNVVLCADKGIALVDQDDFGVLVDDVRNKAVGKRILEYCNERNITPNKLCTMSGIIQSTVNSIFSGRSTNPKLRTIQYLCDGLGISLTEFFNSPLFDELDD